MNHEALLLTLSAALLHATWNFAAKRADDGGPVFVWAYSISSSALWVPIALIWTIWHPLHPQWSWLAGRLRQRHAARGLRQPAAGRATPRAT